MLDFNILKASAISDTDTTKKKKKKSNSLEKLVANPQKKAVSLLCNTVVARFGIPASWCKLAANSLIASGRELDIGSIAAKAKNLMKRNGGTTTVKRVQPFALSGPVTSAPVSVAHQIKRTNRPRMMMRGDGVSVAHSEMLGSILSGNPTAGVTAYRSVGYRANPGISTVFPWLSSVAVNYEKYRFKRLTFSIVPLVSTQFSGRIGVGFDFDSTDLPPGNRQEFYSLSTHSETMPWQATSVTVKCDNLFRFTGTHVASDTKLIDLGQVIIMSDSVSNGAAITTPIPLYDLIVDYEVELIEPQQALFSTQSFTSNKNLTAGVPLGTGTDTTAITGPNVISATTVSTNTVGFTIPAGTYAISSMCVWTAGGPSITATTPTSGVGLKIVEGHAGGTSIISGVFTCQTDMVLNLTVAGNTYVANVDKLNFLFSRVSSSTFAQFLP